MKILYTVRNPWKALMRDLAYLVGLRAIRAIRTEDRAHDVEVNLDWPTEITETEFFRLVKELPKAKVRGFPSS